MPWVRSLGPIDEFLFADGDGGALSWILVSNGKEIVERLVWAQLRPIPLRRVWRT